MVAANHFYFSPRLAQVNEEIARTSKFPRDQKLSGITFPKQLQDKSLIQDMPSSEGSHTMALDKKTHLMARSGEFVVVNSPLGPVQVTSRRKLTGPRRLILETDSQPLALIVQDYRKRYTVFGATPLVSSSARVEPQGSEDFYPWFQVCAQLDGDHVIQVWNGDSFDTILGATVDPIPTKQGNPAIETPVFSQQAAIHADGSTVGRIVKKEQGRLTTLQVMTGPGVDPAMMLCAAVILDDMVGFFK